MSGSLRLPRRSLRRRGRCGRRVGARCPARCGPRGRDPGDGGCCGCRPGRPARRRGCWLWPWPWSWLALVLALVLAALVAVRPGPARRRSWLRSAALLVPVAGSPWFWSPRSWLRSRLLLAAGPARVAVLLAGRGCCWSRFCSGRGFCSRSVLVPVLLAVAARARRRGCSAACLGAGALAGTAPRRRPPAPRRAPPRGLRRCSSRWSSTARCPPSCSAWPPERAPAWAALMASTSCAFFMLPGAGDAHAAGHRLQVGDQHGVESATALLAGALRGTALPVDDADSRGWRIRWFPSREVLPTYQCRTGSSAVGFSCRVLPRTALRLTKEAERRHRERRVHRPEASRRCHRWMRAPNVPGAPPA